MPEGKKRTTIAEVARRAGVSRTAVSYALRDDANIAAATRARIRKVADAMGYRPDPVLAKLMAHLHAGRGRRHLGKIALLNVNEEEAYWRTTAALADFRKSAERCAAALGYETEEFWLHEPGRSPRRLAQMLAARGIRGLLVGSTGRRGSAVDFPWAKFAAVTVGYSVETPALHRVATHHYRNARLALRRVAEAGYRRIGFAALRGAEATMENLHLAGFLAWQQETPEAERVPPLLAEERNAAELRRWFETWRPEVILTVSFEAEHLEAAGVRTPRDAAWVKLLLWDEREDVAGVLPGYDRLGGAAVSLLAGQLQHDEFGVPDNPTIVQVEGRWRGGASLPVRSSVSGA